jgi:K+-transporting ATPase ATPase C chain
MRTILTSLKILAFFTILTGVVYPLAITGIGQLFFPKEANGNIVKNDGTKVGSLLIGQDFDSTIYFWPRPSAISYDPLPSGGSNYGITNPKQVTLVAERKERFIAANHISNDSTIPSEMVFASASGLDPHISPEAARLQSNRVAAARNFNEAQKQKLDELIGNLTEKPQFLFLGQERVNVLLLNLETDKIK